MRQGIYARIKDGTEWGMKIKGSVVPGDPVRILKRDGTSKDEFVDQIISTQQGHAICTIAVGIRKSFFTQKNKFIEQETSRLLKSKPVTNTQPINTQAEYEEYKNQHPERNLPDFDDIPFDGPYIIRKRQ